MTRVALAAIAGAHGINGEVRLKLFTDSAANLASHAALYVGGTSRALLAVKDGGKTAIARFEGISDRALAESLRGALVEIERAALPELDEGEYYHADLLGLPCVDLEDRELGTVVAVENFGAGDLIQVERPDGKRALVPFRPGIAELVDQRIAIDPEFLA